MATHKPAGAAALTSPLTASLVDGELVLIGPGPIGFSMTPEAARATARAIDRALDEEPAPQNHTAGWKDGHVR